MLVTCPASAPCTFTMSIPTDIASFADLGVTPEIVTMFFAFGVGAVLSLWAIGYGVGIATGLIRQL